MSHLMALAMAIERLSTKPLEIVVTNAEWQRLGNELCLLSRRPSEQTFDASSYGGEMRIRGTKITPECRQ